MDIIKTFFTGDPQKNCLQTYTDTQVTKKQNDRNKLTKIWACKQKFIKTKFLHLKIKSKLKLLIWIDQVLLYFLSFQSDFSNTH